MLLTYKSSINSCKCFMHPWNFLWIVEGSCWAWQNKSSERAATICEEMNSWPR